MTTTRRILWISLAAGAAASLAVSAGMARQAIVIGSPEGGWFYPYREAVSGAALVTAALAALGVAALLAVPRRIVRRHEMLVVFAWLLMGLGMQAALRSLTPFTFAQIFGSDTANSFYTPTLHYSAAELLTGFDRLRDSLPLHAKSNMPGKLLFVSGLHYLSHNPGTMAWLAVLCSNMGGLLLYVFVRDLFRDRRTALFSLVLYLFVPAKIYFFPLLNTVTPVPAIACACLLMRWLTTRRAIYAALFGAALYALILFEPLPLVLGLLFAGLIARAISRGDIQRGVAIRHAAATLAAFGAVYLAVLGLFHFDLFATLRQAQKDAAAFNIEANRPYGLWVGHDLLEFGFGLGLGQVMLAVGGIADLMRRSLASARAWRQPIAVVLAALVAILVTTDLLGLNRGEVLRLWIFLACFFQIPAAWACARLNSRAALMLVMATTLLQAALGTAMIGFIVP